MTGIEVSVFSSLEFVGLGTIDLYMPLETVDIWHEPWQLLIEINIGLEPLNRKLTMLPNN